MARPNARSRPQRGDPSETRARLVAAAAAAFQRDGYFGTDTNRIAAAAGYAAGTFYKHFADKREILLAAYAAWIGEEWAAVERAIAAAASTRSRARAVVGLVVRMHARGRGVRAAVLSLLATDPVVRRAYRRQRRRQLDALAALRARGGAAKSTRERDAALLFLLERASDALANRETVDLRLRRAAVIAELVSEVEEALR